MRNEINGELNFNELDQVSGGDVVSWVLGFVAGKVAEAILKANELHADQRAERNARRNR